MGRRKNGRLLTALENSGQKPIFGLERGREG
jgi:hypothetical protein